MTFNASIQGVENGHEWIARADLSESNLTGPIVDLHNSKEYSGAYYYINWLHNYIKKPGVDLSTIGTPTGVIPTGPLSSFRSHPATLNLTTGTFDTVVVIAHIGKNDSQFWVSNTMPYPVKGDVSFPYSCYSTDPEGVPLPCIPSIDYKFELLAYGKGVQSEVPELPLGLTSLVAGITIVIPLVVNRLRLRDSTSKPRRSTTRQL